MSANTTSNNSFLESHSGIERFALFSDAVFAIAITLLALEIRLPAGVELHSDRELLQALLGIWPLYLNYAISFLVIGQYWMIHHRMFRMITRFDRRLMLLNLLLLMCIGFIPFPTAILGEHSGTVGTVLYAGTMVVTGLMNALLWMYATMNKGHLLGVELSQGEIAQSRQRQFLMPCVFLASIAIAFWNADIAKFSWILLLPLALSFSHTGHKNEQSESSSTSEQTVPAA